MGGSGRSARRSGRAGSGKIRCQQNYSPRKKSLPFPARHRRNDASTFFQKHEQAKSSVNLSSPKSGHTTGGSGRHGARRTARRGDAGQNKVPTFRWLWKPIDPLALQRTVKTVLNESSQARTKKILCKPLRGNNVRFIRGLSPVYHRDRERSSLLAVDQCTDAYLSL